MPVAVPGQLDVWSIVHDAPTTRAWQFGRFTPSSRPARIAAIATAAVVIVGVAGTVSYAQASTTLTLSVDGTERSVRTFQDDVADVLRAEGVTVSARDLVAPAPGTDLDDGDTVVVKYARPLTLTVDGKKQDFWTTEQTVDGALRVLGIRAEGGRLSASRSQPIGREGIALRLTTPKKVKVRADGKTRTVTSAAETVGALLAELGLELDGDDRVSRKLSSLVKAGDKIVLKRVVVKTKTVEKAVAHGVVTSKTSDLYKGQSRTVKEGQDGTARVVYRLVYVDGKLSKKKQLRSTLIDEPVAEKREIGTKSRPSSSRSSTPAKGGGKASGLNWAALAKCESGGNPRAVNPAGYYGLYQFSPSTWRSVGGSGLPSNASASEQTARAQTLYNRTGASSWPHCGKYLFS